MADNVQVELFLALTTPIAEPHSREHGYEIKESRQVASVVNLSVPYSARSTR